ncbi:LolA family protein [Natrialbaceae archaeon AArc-T1-2]|uniref:LolA family protein n=1 Tax=Natrialbaceae archaeon AArc-T1-2 TaxID=3053904 RepID=UPI00255AA6D4|nr:DUF2092 domain-containing protein [Natrialbaceae archaeon AArc-T1-2]WIV68234.1 DUF2092 domain-containing protein [Natrialbaceae archaeon AArc-T1-2]
MHRRRLITTGVTAALAGCLSREDEPPTSSELVAEAIETRAGLSDVQAVRTTTAETADGTVERVERVTERPPADNRREVLESSDPLHPEGTVSVRNRLVTWEYDPAAGEVTERHHPNRVIDDRTRLVLESLLEEYDLTYDGTETVDGRTAHVIDVEPPADDDFEYAISVAVGNTEYVIPLQDVDDADEDELTVRRRLWIDDERRYPVKECTVVTDGDDVYHSVTFSYEDVAIDEGVDDDVFTFDPPADVDLVRRGIEPEGVFDSAEAAGSVVPYDLPEPDVSDAYELDRVTVLERDEDTTTTLWYVDPERTHRELFVVVREEQRFDEEVLDAIEFDGQTGYLRDGRIESVFWTCDGLSYEVSSPRGEEPVVEIASSIGCPYDPR